MHIPLAGHCSSQSVHMLVDPLPLGGLACHQQPHETHCKYSRSLNEVTVCCTREHTCEGLEYLCTTILRNLHRSLGRQSCSEAHSIIIYLFQKKFLARAHACNLGSCTRVHDPTVLHAHHSSISLPLYLQVDHQAEQTPCSSLHVPATGKRSLTSGNRILSLYLYLVMRAHRRRAIRDHIDGPCSAS